MYIYSQYPLYLSHSPVMYMPTYLSKVTPTYHHSKVFSDFPFHPKKKPKPLKRPRSQYPVLFVSFCFSSPSTLPLVSSILTQGASWCSLGIPSTLLPQGLSPFFLPLPGMLAFPDIRWLTSFPWMDGWMSFLLSLECMFHEDRTLLCFVYYYIILSGK